MSRMRIAALTNAFPTRGAPNFGRPTFQRLAALSALADVAVFVADPRHGVLRPNYFLPHGQGEPERIDGVAVTYVTYTAIPVVSRALNGWLLGRRLAPLAARFRPDVVLGYFVHPEGSAAVEAARRLGVPSVVCAIGSDLRQISGSVVRRCISGTLRRASRVITVSEELRGRAVALGADPQHVRTIRNGCDTAIFRLADRGAARAALGIPASAGLILFTGSLLPLKGVYPLVEAFETLSRTDPAIELAMIGDGTLKPELLRRSAAFGGRLRLPGRLAPAEVARWLAAADVFCLPSYSEGSPNAIIEALCCGRPVVASNVGGIPELINETCGLTVPPGDAASLAGALAAALKTAWSTGAIVAAATRPWSDTARETLEVCRAAAGLRGAGASGRTEAAEVNF